MRDYARKAVTGDMTAICLHKNEFGRYEYNYAGVICKQIDQVIERQCFKETADSMKGLKEKTPNVLTEMKAGVAVTKAAVLKASRYKAAAASTSSITAAPENRRRRRPQRSGPTEHFLPCSDRLEGSGGEGNNRPRRRGDNKPRPLDRGRQQLPRSRRLQAPSAVHGNHVGSGPTRGNKHQTAIRRPCRNDVRFSRDVRSELRATHGRRNEIPGIWDSRPRQPHAKHIDGKSGVGSRAVVGERDPRRLPRHKEAVQIHPRLHLNLTQGDKESDGRGGRGTRPQKSKGARGNGRHCKPRDGDISAISTYTPCVH